MLEQLLEGFPGMRLADGHEHRLAPGVLVRRPASLPVVLGASRHPAEAAGT